MILCSVTENAPELKTFLQINDARLGAWKIELEDIKSFYSPGPKSYAMIAKGKNPDELINVIKCKGFSLLQPLLQRNQQEKAFEYLVKDALTPLNILQELTVEDKEEEEENQTSHVNTKLRRPKMYVFQQRLNIDQRTFLPKKIEMFKSLNVIGPQSVLNIKDYVIFENENVDEKLECPRVIGPPPQWGNKSCTESDIFNHFETLPSESNQYDGYQKNPEIVKMVGIVPAYPYGYDLNHPETKSHPFEKLSYKNKETK